MRREESLLYVRLVPAVLLLEVVEGEGLEQFVLVTTAEDVHFSLDELVTDGLDELPEPTDEYIDVDNVHLVEAATVVLRHSRHARLDAANRDLSDADTLEINDVVHVLNFAGDHGIFDSVVH